MEENKKRKRRTKKKKPEAPTQSMAARLSKKEINRLTMLYRQQLEAVANNPSGLMPPMPFMPPPFMQQPTGFFPPAPTHYMPLNNPNSYNDFIAHLQPPQQVQQSLVFPPSTTSAWSMGWSTTTSAKRWGQFNNIECFRWKCYVQSTHKWFVQGDWQRNSNYSKRTANSCVKPTSSTRSLK